MTEMKSTKAGFIQLSVKNSLAQAPVFTIHTNVKSKDILSRQVCACAILV